MKNFYNSKLIKCVSNVKSYLILTMILLNISVSNAQVNVMGTAVVTVTGDAAGIYADLNAAITAVNAVTTLTQNTVVTVPSSSPQTAPAGGYAITATGTASFSLTITGSGNTVTASSAQVVGSLNDGIFKIIGADYVTIQGFVMQENAGNTITAAATNTMTEWGVALLYASLTDGAQNNTIQNNTISLNRTYSNTFGVYSNTRHSATIPLTVAEVTAASGTNSGNKVYSNTISNVDRGIVFVGSGTTAIVFDSGNDIGGSSAATGNTITNWGGLVSGALASYPSVTGSAVCIYMNQQVGDNVSFNTITSATNITTLTTTGFFGIFKAFTAGQPTGLTFTSNYNSNTVTMTNAPTTSEMQAMSLQGLAALPTATINCSNNNILNCAVTGTTATTAGMIGILSSSAAGTLNITENTIRGFTTTASTTGRFLGIQQQTAGVVNVFNINNNKIGDATAGAVNFLNTTLSASVTGISVTNTGAATTCALSITGNDIRGIQYTTSGTGAHTYITNASTASTQNISNNTFTNLNVNTTGNVTFISNSNSNGSATGIKNVNGNSIVGSFNKAGAGGTVTLFTDSGSDVTGALNNSNNNTFSNITVTGATVIAGFINTNGGTPTKSINGNTLTNWTGGTSAITGLSVGATGESTVFGNTISNITSAGNITGTASISGTLVNFTQNTVHSLTSSGATATVTGMANSGGTTKNFSKNKIYNLESNAAGGFVNGILVSGGTTITLTNNIIGDLRTPAANAANPLNGINITGGTTVNVFYNTVLLSGTSAGALFGSSAISASTTPALTLRNNIFVNNCTPVGATGFVSAYRRSTTTLTTYNTASNTNLFFAGTPGVNNLIHYDGTNSYQTLAIFKTAMGTRDAQSITENPTFVSTTGSNATFLHINTTVATQIESGATAVAGITDDFDGDSRNASTPDIGADEFAGILLDISSPSITAIAFTTDSCNATSRNFTATIADFSNVSIGATAPRIYFRKNAGAYFSEQGTLTSGTVASGSWSFNITYATLGGVVLADVIDYFIVAQDAVGNVGGSPSLGLVLTNVNTVTTPPTTPSTYAIQGSIGGSYNVGTGQTFPTLTAAVNAYNTSCLSSAVTFVLTDLSYSAGETFPISINANFDASAIKSLTIKPAVAGTVISGSANSALIRLNGANFITIDGSTSGGSDRSLTISNTSITTPGVVLIGSLGTTPTTNNALRNCVIINGINTSSAIVISDATTSGTAGFFSNITIHNNDIQKAFIGVFAQGGTTPQNGSNLTYTNNTINTSGANAIRQVGLYMQGVNGATVSNNTLGSFDATSGENDAAIWLATGTTNATVSGNTVSNLGMILTTGFAPRGIMDTSGLAISGNVISNNTISNLTTTGGTAIIGIENNGGGTIIERNNISGIINNSTNTWGAYGINISGNNNAIIRNNFVSNITGDMTGGGAFSAQFGIFGIRVASGTGHQVYFNSVNLYGVRSGAVNTSLLTAAFGLTSTTITGCDVRNNIFANNITGGTTNVANVAVFLPSAGTSAMNLTMNRNLYFYGTDSASGAGQAGTTAGTNFFVGLPALLGYSSTLSAAATNDNASFGNTTAVPFTTATDLHITTSNDLGVTIASVPLDIDLFARTATPDIGADEFTPCTTALGGTATATVTSFCNATSSTTITASGYSEASPTITYIWQRSSDLAFTTPVDIGVASSTYADLNTGIIANTTFYRLKVLCTAASVTDFSTIATVTINTIDYANLQFPPTAAICQGSTFTAYGQVYEQGITDASQIAQGGGIDVEFGISPIGSNTNPNTWTNWSAATYNTSGPVSNNDEYQFTAGAALPVGTYYYTFRYKLTACSTWQYGGYTPSGGFFWDGTTNVSGVLTVSPLTTAGSVTTSICAGGSYTWSLPEGTGLTYTTAQTNLTNVVGCNTATLNLTVTPLTTTGSVTTSICAGGSYTWPANGITYTTAQTGVTVVTACNTATLNLTVTPLTTTGSVTTSICAGGSYTWPANGVTYTTAQTGVTVVTACNTATLNLTVNALPATPTGSATQTISVTNVNNATIANLVVNPTIGIVWYGSLANAQAGTNPLPTTTVLVSGSTYWAVNVGTTCNSTPFAVTVTVALGNEGFDNANFSFYPNPTSSIVNISYSNAITKVTVMNLLGQILHENRSNELQVTVDLSSYPSATYLIRVEADAQSKIIKVVKK